MKHIMPFKQVVFIVGFALAFASCTTTRVVKPLEKGEVQLGLDVGGPIVNTQMLPLSSLHFAYGVHDKLSFFGGIHTTTLAFQTLQLDFGWCYNVLEQDGFKPGISVNAVFNPMLSLRNADFRLFPEISPNLYWELGEKHLLHLGMINWFDLTPGTVDIGNSAVWHPSFQVGYRFEMKRFVFAADYRILNINKEIVVPQANVPTWTGGGGQGIYFSVNYRFNRLKNKGNE